jgi:hypothetical protein
MQALPMRLREQVIGALNLPPAVGCNWPRSRGIFRGAYRPLAAA